MHYKSFVEAKQKWYSRMKKMTDNIGVIMEAYQDIPYEKWNCISFPKVCLAHSMNEAVDNIIYLKCYRKNFTNAKIMKYSGWCGKRFLDKEFDYVAFINTLIG